MIETRISDIEALLELEEASLRNQDFSALAVILKQKAELFKELDAENVSFDSKEIRNILMRIEHNQRLHKATLGGLRSVIDRLEAIKRAASHLDTYTASGARKDLVQPKSKMEKRA